MNTTRIYIHLAGQAFHEEAETLARRMGLGTDADLVPNLVPQNENLVEPGNTEDA